MYFKKILRFIILSVFYISILYNSNAYASKDSNEEIIEYASKRLETKEIPDGDRDTILTISPEVPSLLNEDIPSTSYTLLIIRNEPFTKGLSSNDVFLMEFPSEILLNILSYLDAKSIINFRFTNRRGYDLTHGSFLVHRIRMHYGIPITNMESGLILNGNNQYGEISDIIGTPLAVGDGPFTILMEIKVNGNQNSIDPHLLRFGQHSNNQDAVLALHHDKVKYGSCAQEWSYTDGYSLNDNQWHHIAFVRTKTFQALYVDGVERGKSNNFNPNILGGQLRIGAITTNGYHGNQLFLFSGYIRNVAFFNSAQSASEIQRNLVKKRICSTGLIAFWEFHNEGSKRISDQSGNNYDLILFNSPNFLN